MDIISHVSTKENRIFGSGQPDSLGPSSRFPAGLPAASKTLFDNSSRLAYKRAIFEIFGTASPARGQLRELARQASVLVGRKKEWTGSHLYNLLNLDGFKRYGLNPDLLYAVKRLAKGGIEEEVDNVIDIEKIEANKKCVGCYTKADKKRKKEGRGQGFGSEYSPWIHVQDFPSRGLSTRINGYKTRRTHHFFSKLELENYLIIERETSVVDLREQFPLLPIEETIQIANDLGIKHPTEPKTKLPVVMTTDLLTTVQYGMTQEYFAISVKYTKDLESPRVIGKFEIERQYWKRHHVDWAIVTEREIPRVLLNNIKLVRDYRDIKDRVVIGKKEMTRLEKVFRKPLAEMPLRKGCRYCEKKYKLSKGTALVLVYHFIANKRWLVDMLRPIEPGKPLCFQKRNSDR